MLVDSDCDGDKHMLSGSSVVPEDDDDDEDDDGTYDLLSFSNDNEGDKLFQTFTDKKDKNCLTIEPIDPPLEFQDVPVSLMSRNSLKYLAEGLVDQIVGEAVNRSEKEYMSRSCCTPEPQSSWRPSSRNSLNSRLSSSHNSLSVPTANKADDSSFITSAMSHDVLDMYNVPLDSDIYTLPVDSLRPPCPQRPKRQQRHHRKRKKNSTDTKESNSTSNDLINLKSNGPVKDTLPPMRLITDCSLDFSSDQSLVDYKRHSLPSTSMSGCVNGRTHCAEPIHMTLQEVRQFLHNLYSSTSSNHSNDTYKNDSDDNHCPAVGSLRTKMVINNDAMLVNSSDNPKITINNSSSRNKRHILTTNSRKPRNSKSTFAINIKNRKSKSFAVESDVSVFNNNNNNNNINNYNNNNNHTNKLSDEVGRGCVDKVMSKKETLTTSKAFVSGSNNDNVSNNFNNRSQGSGCTKNSFSYTLKQTLCNIFRFTRRSEVSNQCRSVADTVLVLGVSSRTTANNGPPPFTKRALPPLPPHNMSKEGVDKSNISCTESSPEVINIPEEDVDEDDDEEEEENMVDFASSIEKVKDYGWYWGPISGETAEKILSNEPDGSFIVRDSSDDHYIFSLTFKLNGIVRHVRIEHDQGNFSFGSCTKFKSHTIVEFIENAVEHSRSGRYLFFLHRRPIHGPMRVQLLHPVSRFKQVQSLQHMSRFVILKVVRRDLIPSLPLPRRIIDYLNSPHYYSEHPSLPADDHHPSSSPSLHVFSFLPPNS